MSPKTTLKLLTVPEVAEILRVTRMTVYRLVEKKQLGYTYRQGKRLRFSPEQVEEYMQRTAPKVVPPQPQPTQKAEKHARDIFYTPSTGDLVKLEGLVAEQIGPSMWRVQVDTLSGRQEYTIHQEAMTLVARRKKVKMSELRELYGKNIEIVQD